MVFLGLLLSGKSGKKREESGKNPGDSGNEDFSLLSELEVSRFMVYFSHRKSQISPLFLFTSASVFLSQLVGYVAFHVTFHGVVTQESSAFPTHIKIFGRKYLTSLTFTIVGMMRRISLLELLVFSGFIAFLALSSRGPFLMKDPRSKCTSLQRAL